MIGAYMKYFVLTCAISMTLAFLFLAGVTTYCWTVFGITFPTTWFGIIAVSFAIFPLLDIYKEIK